MTVTDDPRRRSAAPVLGITLVILGIALLAQAAYPTADWPRTIFDVIVSLISASAWAISLYIGTLLTLITLPALLGLGVWLLIAAVRRAWARNGIGWELPTGAILFALGWSCVLEPPVGPPFLPVVLATLGAGLLVRRRAADGATEDERPAIRAGAGTGD